MAVRSQLPSGRENQVLIYNMGKKHRLDDGTQKAVKPAGNVEEIRTPTTAESDGAKVREKALGPLSVLPSPQASGG
jgi:hypothetical protein